MSSSWHECVGYLWRIMYTPLEIHNLFSRRSRVTCMFIIISWRNYRGCRHFVPCLSLFLDRVSADTRGTCHVYCKIEGVLPTCSSRGTANCVFTRQKSCSDQYSLVAWPRSNSSLSLSIRFQCCRCHRLLGRSLRSAAPTPETTQTSSGLSKSTNTNANKTAASRTSQAQATASATTP